MRVCKNFAKFNVVLQLLDLNFVSHRVRVPISRSRPQNKGYYGVSTRMPIVWLAKWLSYDSGYKVTMLLALWKHGQLYG